MRHGHSEIPNLLRAAFVHRTSLFAEAFALQPKARFEICDQLGTKFLCNRHQVTEVIRVRMT